MLPRAALHQENVIRNEPLNHQRVEAGQIAPMFSVNTWSTLACAFVITHPLRIFACLSFSLWSCLLECEVNNVYTQQTRHHPHEDGAVENVVKKLWRWNFGTVQQDHRRIQREVIQHNLLHPCVHLHRFLHRCVQSMNFSDHSRSVLFFFTDSHLPLGLSASLSGYHVFFYIYYTTLEYVCFITHLSLYITLFTWVCVL